MARLARSTARPWEQSLPSRCAGHGDSANPETREREHHATHYIKTAADDVRIAMAKLEDIIPMTPRKAAEETPVIPEDPTLQDTYGTLSPDSTAVPSPVN